MAQRPWLPKPDHLQLRFFLDEGVSDDVGHVLEERGHTVIYGNRSLLRGSKDPVIATAAITNDCILIAEDHDMRAIAKASGISRSRFKSLSLIKISCPPTQAHNKIRQAMSLIEHEWLCREGETRRRLWIELQPSVIRIVRDA